MYSIFGITMNIGWYIALFFVCQIINVALNTAKTIIMHKEEKISSSIINAVTYGFYAIIVVMTASNLALWITIVISVITNLIGVYGSMLILEKLKKDKLWEIVATVQDSISATYLISEIDEEDIAFNDIETSNGDTVFHIYSENQKQSKTIKELLNKYGAKYIVHQEQVKL